MQFFWTRMLSCPLCNDMLWPRQCEYCLEIAQLQFLDMFFDDRCPQVQFLNLLFMPVVMRTIVEIPQVQFSVQFVPVYADTCGDSCRGNRPCTSYSRTIYNTKMATDGYDIAYTFTHNNITLEHNAMNNKNTIAHMNVHNTQY